MIAFQTIEPPTATDDGVAEHEAIRSTGEVVTVALQFAVAVSAPEVTVMVAFFTPAEEYVLETFWVVPERESVPFQE